MTASVFEVIVVIELGVVAFVQAIRLFANRP